MTETKRTSSEEAQRVGDAIGVDWNRFELEQFRAGMDVEFEHGSHDPQTDVTHDDPIVTGKIALAHMKEFPDYYERLERMERQAELDWADKPRLSGCRQAAASAGSRLTSSASCDSRPARSRRREREPDPVEPVALEPAELEGDGSNLEQDRVQLVARHHAASSAGASSGSSATGTASAAFGSIITAASTAASAATPART